MKNWKKRALSGLSCAALLTGLLGTGAFAAKAGTASAIGVELNGQAMTFTDAVPEADQGRTFLPFRAVFEALGAEVGYDNATKTVSATRGDTTVSMVVGETQATVTENGVTTTLPMDVAAYAKNNRTYVPVRFAAQALGCTVGWDNTAKTVILVDTQTLIDEAVQDKSFSLLEKYMAYSNQFNEGNWSMTAEMSMLMSMMATEVLNMSGSVTGITADTSAGEMTMELNMDMSGLIALLTQMTGLTEEEVLADSNLTADDLKMDVTMEMRMDLEGGMLYLLISGLPEDSGLPADTWLSMDLNEVMAQAGLDLDQLMSLSQSFDPAAAAAAQVSLLNLTDADTAYQTVTDAVNAAVAALTDDAFTQDGLVYTNEMDTELGTVVLALTTNTAGEVVGYEMTADLSIDLADLGVDTSSLAALGLSADTIELTMETSMDAEHAMTAAVTMDAGTLVSLTMTMNGQYSETDETPETTLPAGANVVDYYEWLATSAAAAQA